MSAIFGSRHFCDAVFGWKVEPESPVVPDPIPAPRIGPQASLEKMLGGPLDRIGRDAEVSLEHGISVGGVIEVKNAAGNVTGYRPRHFASLVEAGVAGKIAHLEAIDADPAIVAEARRLEPLARRYALRQQLEALV